MVYVIQTRILVVILRAASSAAVEVPLVLVVFLAICKKI
jgi:hypothetical protein